MWRFPGMRDEKFIYCCHKNCDPGPPGSIKSPVMKILRRTPAFRGTRAPATNRMGLTRSSASWLAGAGSPSSWAVTRPAIQGAKVKPRLPSPVASHIPATRGASDQHAARCASPPKRSRAASDIGQRPGDRQAVRRGRAHPARETAALSGAPRMPVRGQPCAAPPGWRRADGLTCGGPVCGWNVAPHRRSPPRPRHNAALAVPRAGLGQAGRALDLTEPRFEPCPGRRVPRPSRWQG